jgi:dihydrofolate synthase/folylpolyglutamate synthase
MSADRSYQQCLNEMFNLRRFGIKLGLETIHQILVDLGNPQQKFRTIHVAGTNGKGSVAAILASILQTCGNKTGLYTSPHLIRFNERIVVDGHPIDDEDVLSAYKAVKAVHHGDREPTFFEFTTAMALLEFRRRKVSWAVIETGMGGRLDATNVIHPALSIITNVSVEHSEYLGSSIRQIAAEKAGIIKSGVPVVTGVRQKSAVEVVVAAAAARHAPLYRMGKDFRVRRTSQNTFNFQSPQTKWTGLASSLAGQHQLENTALALAACDVLSPEFPKLTQNCVKKALLNTRWPGRLEKVMDRPLTLLDGAHNLIAARKLAKYLGSYLAGRRITLVIGILDDKPYRAMLEALVPTCHRIIVTQPKIQRALPTEILETAAKELTKEVDVVRDVSQAVAAAIASSAPDDVVCIAGSLYVVGEAKAALADQSPPLSV